MGIYSHICLGKSERSPLGLRSKKVSELTNGVKSLVTTNGLNVKRTQVLVWATANSSTPTPISTAETSVEGLTNWQVSVLTFATV